MFMSSDPLHWPDIVSTPSIPRAEAIELEKKGWWRPIIGFLVEPRKERTFGRHQDYHLGYVLALAQQSQGALLVANTTAALLLGHPVWPKPTDISVYKYKGRLKVRALRPHPRATGPVHMRPMTASGPIGVYDLGKGVFVTNREQTAVDVARLEASQTAFIIVCSVLGALATSGDVYQDRLDAGFLKREAEARKRMIAIAEKLPLERLVIETDCPYMTPEPHRGERYSPLLIHLTLETLAKVRNISLEEAAAAAYQNAMDLFGISL